MKIQGTVIAITPVNQVSERFSESNLVLNLPTNDPQYPKILAIQFSNTNVGLPSQFPIGQLVEVDFEIVSREHGGKYYTTARGWKISAVGMAVQQQPQQQQQYQAPQPTPSAVPYQPSQNNAPAQYGNQYQQPTTQVNQGFAPPQQFDTNVPF